VVVASLALCARCQQETDITGKTIVFDGGRVLLLVREARLSRGALVLVDQATEQVAALDLAYE
jgi:hypothetical protein